MVLLCPICDVVYCSEKRRYYDRHLTKHKKEADRLVHDAVDGPGSKKARESGTEDAAAEEVAQPTEKNTTVAVKAAAKKESSSDDSAHALPTAWPPINTSGNLRCTCLQSHLQLYPPNHKKSYTEFRNHKTLLKSPLTLCPAKYSPVRGRRGGHLGVSGKPDSV